MRYIISAFLLSLLLTTPSSAQVCEIMGSGAASSYLPLLLLIPAFILIRRLLRRKKDTA